MKNFVYDIPTKVYFGKDQIQSLSELVKNLGKKLLIVYGGGSIKKNGIYDSVLEQLKKADGEWFELSGIEPNSRIATVKKGIQLCKEKKIDGVLAVGGGSVIDCSKAICAGAYYNGDPWNLVMNPSLIKNALPLIAIPTMAATGSEMDHIAVITNEDTDEKIGTRHPLLRPIASILDPTYTFSVSPYQSAAGVADIMSHIMESYFSKEPGLILENVAIGLLKTCMDSGLKVLEDPEDYEARANLMWVSCWAINDFLKLGRPVAWSVHPIEHQLSAVYDITHGVGLAILTPHWMEYVLNENTVDIFEGFFRKLWDWQDKELDSYELVYKGIEELNKFYAKLNLPMTLHELDIDSSQFSAMAKKAEKQVQQGFVPLSESDIVKIYEASL